MEEECPVGARESNRCREEHKAGGRPGFASLAVLLGSEKGDWKLAVAGCGSEIGGNEKVLCHFFLALCWFPHGGRKGLVLLPSDQTEGQDQK